MFIEKAEAFAEEADKQFDELTQKYRDVLGDGISYIDPMGFTKAVSYSYESSSLFLSRTLLTGSDIAELTHSLLNEFTDITLRLDLPE
jgi:hypothetical protein